MPAEVWTDEDARIAVASLGDVIVDALAQGPVEDPDGCRVCEVLDDFMFGHAPGDRWAEDESGERYLAVSDPETEHALVLVEYHRDQANNGTGDEAYRRCHVVYEAARNVRSARETA